MKRNFVGHLFNYKLRFFLSLAVLFSLVFIFGGGFAFKLRQTIRVFRDLQALTMPNITQDEILTFQNSVISVIKQKGDGLHNYIAEANIRRNISEEFHFKQNFFYKNDYKMEGLEARIWLVNAGSARERWLEYYEVKSDSLNIIGENTFKLYGNVEILTRAREKNKTNKATMSMVIFENIKNIISGYNLVFRNDDGVLKSGTFAVFLKQDEVTFGEGVNYENKEYKIASKSARALLESGDVKSLFLKDKVRFEQFEADKTIVFGNSASYDKKSGKLIILGDVRIFNQARNLTIKAERFIYDENLKKGLFDAPKASKPVEAEIEI